MSIIIVIVYLQSNAGGQAAGGTSQMKIRQIPVMHEDQDIGRNSSSPSQGGRDMNSGTSFHKGSVIGPSNNSPSFRQIPIVHQQFEPVEGFRSFNLGPPGGGQSFTSPSSPRGGNFTSSLPSESAFSRTNSSRMREIPIISSDPGEIWNEIDNTVGSMGEWGPSNSPHPRSNFSSESGGARLNGTTPRSFSQYENVTPGVPPSSIDSFRYPSASYSDTPSRDESRGSFSTSRVPQFEERNVQSPRSGVNDNGGGGGFVRVEVYSPKPSKQDSSVRTEIPVVIQEPEPRKQDVQDGSSSWQQQEDRYGSLRLPTAHQ